MISRCRHSLDARTKTAGGFTLLELMVVLVILALLTTIAAPEVMKHLRKAKQDTAKLQLESLAQAVDYFQIDLGRLPSPEEGLKVLRERPANESRWDGPYVKKDVSLTDPWGETYLYKSPGEHGAFDIYTLGSDKRAGGEGEARDLGNW
jgi:general secretion pathway protein G